MIQRVNGSLAVSRALGDFEYKNVDGKGPTEQLVSPEPGMSSEEGHDTRSTHTEKTITSAIWYSKRNKLIII